MATPSIINHWTRGAMRRVRSFPDGERMQIFDAIPRRNKNAIARARSHEWLDAEHAIAVCDALVEILGAERSVVFWRDFVYDSWVGGLLEPLTQDLRSEDTITRRHCVLALAPSAWAMSARDCGEIVVSTNADGRLQLEAHDLPPAVRVSEGIQVLYAGAIKAMLEFSQVRASVEIIDTDGRLAFGLRFKASE